MSVTIPRQIAVWWRTFVGDLTAGRVSLGELLEVVASDLEGTGDDDVCPMCGQRPIGPRGERLTPAQRAGICVLCHTRRLRQAHVDELARLQARVELNDAQQQLCRFRRQHGIPAPKGPRRPTENDD